MPEPNARQRGDTVARDVHAADPARRAGLVRLAVVGLIAALPVLGGVGCGAGTGGGGRRGTNDLSLLGVTLAPGIELGADRAALDAAATAAFERAGRRRFEGAERVRTEIDPARLDPILEAFGRTGALVPDALQTLMAAPIAHRGGLLLRIEENAVERLEPTAEPVRRDGIDTGNERIVQAVRRRVRLSATRVDLNSGAVRPLGTWTTAAEARTEHETERREGFVASIAASIADRMAGRPGAPAPPEAPPAEAALAVLFEEVARELPDR